MNKEQKMKKITGLFVAMLLLLSSCGSVPLTGRKQVLLVSDQEVLSSSLTQYSDYMKSAKKSSSKDGAAMVTRVGKKIAAATEQYLKNNGLESEIKNFAWEFKLVNDSQVNAKHSNERMSQQLMAQYGAQILGQALSNKSAAVQQIGNSVYGLGAQYGVMLPFSRKHESEADYMGLVFMAMAGYNPEVAVNFWQKMSAGKSGSTPEFMSTHPSDATRINEIKRHLPEIEKYRVKK